MAYDDQEKKQLSPEEIDTREKALGKKYDDSSFRYERDLKGDKQQDLREQSQAAEQAETDALQAKVQEDATESLKEDKAEDTGFYTGSKGEKGSGTARRGRFKITRLMKNRKMLAGLGLGAGGLIVGSVLLFNFLNIFKLDHLLSNIDTKTFSRINAVFDRRSDKWIRSYIRLRLAERDGTLSRTDDDNLYFRANRIDNDDPVKDWYRTLRANRFEEKVFNRSGIYFASAVDTNGNVRYAQITIDGQNRRVNLPGEGKSINDLNQEELNRYFNNVDGFTETLFEGPQADRDTRRAIKQVVKDNTRFFQVLKRRHVRKDIQNRIGVRDWRFFETSRNRASNVRRELQIKLLNKLLPDDTKGTKFILCVFGAGPCPSNTDGNNPANRSGSNFDGTRTDSEGDRQQFDEEGNVLTNEDGEIIPGDRSSNGEVGDLVERAVRESIEEAGENLGTSAFERLLRSKIMTQLISKVNPVGAALSVIEILDTLSRIDRNITSGKLAELAVLAKSAQAMAAYTTYSIAKDQARSGELTHEEYNLLLETMDGAENSEAGTFFLKQQNFTSTVSAATSKQTYCSDEYVPQREEYVWNCDKYKPGSAKDAEALQESYANTLGTMLTPLLEGYRSIRDRPIIGTVLDFVNSISSTASAIISKITGPIFQALGITGAIEEAMAWIGERAMAFLGAGPILAGSSSIPGLTFTMGAHGSEVTAENSMRASGAALSNPVTMKYAEDIQFAFEDDQMATKSVFERYLSVANHESFASQSLFSLSSIKASDVAGLPQKMLTTVGSILSGRAFADNHQTPAEFSGIDTYDFPAYCIDRDPLLRVEPTEMTNADTVQNEEGDPFIDPEEVTWDLLRDQDAFWAKAYEKVDIDGTDPQTIMQIYNCETLDKRVRGSLGNTSGYKDDGGLEDGASGSTTDASGPITLLGDLAFPLAVTKSQVKSPGIFQNGDTQIAGHPYIAYDILADKGTTVVAMTSGKVVRTSDDCGGQTGSVTINIPEQGISIWYGHLDPGSILVKEGQEVTAGTPLAQLVDSSVDCKSGADHLHIDASTNVGGSVFRPGCARAGNGGCPPENATRFVSIGKQLFDLYQALPE